MKYGFMPKLMWKVFRGSFEKAAATQLNEENAKALMDKAQIKYKEILSEVNEFEKGDRFLVNILSCAMLASVLLVSDKKYDLEEVRNFYRTAMITNKILRMKAQSNVSYTEKGRKKLKAQAAKSQKSSNPYSWRFTVSDGENINKYTAHFYTCGICYLMKQLGLFEYVPALCSLDYDLAAMNNTVFTRDHTIAEGANNCDCHYSHRV